jgi:non-canonical poly(A) RNA polymerase PAPD5/7
MRLFLEYMKPTVAEEAARDRVVSDLRAVIKAVLPDHSTEVFGSQRTGLALATSDIDIRLFEEGTVRTRGTRPNAAPRYEVRKQLEMHLTQLHLRLNLHPDYVLIQRRYARYPLISLQHKDSGFDIQIVCSNDTTHSRELTRGLLKEDPDLHALYVVFKVMFDIRGLTDVYRGGAGSYTLFTMIVAAIENRREFIRQPSLGAKFMEILDFYIKFNSYKHALAVKTPEFEGIWPKLPFAETQVPRPEARAGNYLVSPRAISR